MTNQEATELVEMAAVPDYNRSTGSYSADPQPNGAGSLQSFSRLGFPLPAQHAANDMIVAWLDPFWSWMTTPRSASWPDVY